MTQAFPNSGLMAVGGILFLRFICPSIFAPEGMEREQGRAEGRGRGKRERGEGEGRCLIEACREISMYLHICVSFYRY